MFAGAQQVDALSDRKRVRAPARGSAFAEDRFVLYVEGPRDREILETWARRAAPGLARCIARKSVILGGRQPARALRDFRARGGEADGWRGLVVLDRDHHPSGPLDEARAELGQEPGLELFVWGLRHIESYLLVPDAIRRLLRLSAEDDRIERALRALAERERTGEDGAGRAPLEPDASDLDDLSAGRDATHAKRVLGAGGLLSESLGQELRAGEIARAMRAEELHQDVHALLARVGALSGLARSSPEVVIRRS